MMPAEYALLLIHATVGTGTVLRYLLISNALVTTPPGVFMSKTMTDAP